MNLRNSIFEKVVMKIRNQKKSFKVISLFLLVVAVVGLFLLDSSFAQKNNEKKNSHKKTDNLQEAEPINVVKNFWRLSQAGELDKAKELKTRTYKGLDFGINTEKYHKEREEIIYESGLSLASIEQVNIISEDECEIAVKVKRSNGSKYYLFHTLVKNNNEWKIFSTTY